MPFLLIWTLPFSCSSSFSPLYLQVGQYLMQYSGASYPTSRVKGRHYSNSNSKITLCLSSKCSPWIFVRNYVPTPYQCCLSSFFPPNHKKSKHFFFLLSRASVIFWFLSFFFFFLIFFFSFFFFFKFEDFVLHVTINMLKVCVLNVISRILNDKLLAVSRKGIFFLFIRRLYLEFKNKHEF